jgi:proton glutamate symport protein
VKNIPLHIKIVTGIVAGIAWGFTSRHFNLSPEITTFYLKPAGTIFLNLLLMVAIPLVFVSLSLGVAKLGDIRKFSRMGARTLLVYLFSMTTAITIGLFLANTFAPGKTISPETRTKLESKLKESAYGKIEKAEEITTESQPLQPVIDIVPRNIISSASENSNMLQMVFVAMLTGIALLKINPLKAKPVIDVLEGLNEVLIKIIDFIMAFAPYGVFGLIAAFIVETRDPDLLLGVIWYAITVLGGLLLMVIFVYPFLLTFFSNFKVMDFYRRVRPAMLLAFSTSSSNATLPLAMSTSEKELGISPEVSGFVLPLGATVNMDGTSLYQAVAAVFIAQVFNMDLTFTDQLTILFTSLLASIGAAGIPGAGMVMLVIVLKSVGIPLEGIVLILAPDRILDMCRTVLNVVSDLVTATIVEKYEKKESLDNTHKS